MGLVFQAEGHRYLLDGQPIPSVTTLLGKLHSFAGVPEDVLEAARQRGTAVHRACHFLDEDDLDESQLTEQVAGYLSGWKRFKAESGCVIHECETMAAHPVHRFAGTWDRVLSFPTFDRGTLDIKTGEPHWVMGMQCAAYNALRGVLPSPRATLHLRVDGTYRLKRWTDPSDWPAFLSLVTLHTLMEKHRGPV